MKTKILVVAIVVLGIALASFGTAQAITNGQPDGNNHPYVGRIMFYDADNVPRSWTCSGSLISEQRFLTAGHCVVLEAGLVRAQVWFDPGPLTLDPAYTGGSCNVGGPYTGFPCAGGTWGTPHANLFYDVAVVLLDEVVTGQGYAALPSPGQVDTLANKTSLDLVGYGMQEQVMAYPGQPLLWRWTGIGERMYAPSEIIAGNFPWSDRYIRIAMNPGGGSGGVCYGDSGGPDLLAGTNTVLAVNSFANNVNCAGVGHSARVDLPEVLAWIDGFLQ
jgi:hypothetical protein